MQQSPIVYVEDEEDYQKLVTRILGQAGLSVRVADTGEEGLRHLERERPSLLMLDVNLPDTDGYSICRKLREEATWRNLPILMLTVRRRPEEWLNGFSCGADDYVSKPLNPPELIERVRACLEGKSARASGGPEHAEYLLIQSAIAGNRGSFEVLIRQHKEGLLASMTQQAKNAAEAEDIVSTAFLTAFEKLPEFRGESSFHTWVYGIALHELYHRWRRAPTFSLDEMTQEENGILPRGLSMVDPEPTTGAASEILPVAQIQSILGTLPRKYQRVLDHNVIQGHTVEALSRRWDMPVPTLKWRVATAKRLLCQAWERSRIKDSFHIH